MGKGNGLNSRATAATEGRTNVCKWDGARAPTALGEDEGKWGSDIKCVMAAVLCCCAVRDGRHARSRALHVFLRLGCSSFCGPSECLRGQGDGSSHGPCAVVRRAVNWLFSFFSLRRSLPAISAFDANEAFVWEGATAGNEGLLGAKSIAARPSRTGK